MNFERAQSEERFKRAVTRICYEAFWLHTFQVAIDRLKNIDSIGLDFFRVSWVALQDARLIRLIRILEKNKKSKNSKKVDSVWYLRCYNKVEFDKYLKKTELNLTDLEEVSQQLSKIRNKTFVHLDESGVRDPQTIYREAGLTLDRISWLIEQLWKLATLIHKEVLLSDFSYDDYAGHDIKIVAMLRDSAELGERACSARLE